MSGEKQPRKIAILGTAEPHWREAPFADPTWEIWTCGGVFATAPRVDRHIEIHTRSETCKGWGVPEEEEAARNVYWNWLASQGPKAMLQARSDDTPEASVYPIASILERFPDRYFTNTISYMLALAIAEGCDELGLWGVDMALTGDPLVPASNEYSVQRPSVEFYLGIATGCGIGLHVSASSTLLTARQLYGYEGGDTGWLVAARAKCTELAQKKEEARRMKLQKRHELFEAEKMEAAMATSLEIAGYYTRNFEF